ncbi:MAG: WGR domain-containing protein [Enterococcus sp.]|nr:WGR domain-containing protein [Enterococcus sp.]
MAIIEETMLILVSATANSNKFYHVTLSDTGQVAKRYGRVGVEGVTNYENTGAAGYRKIIAAKKKKGYKEAEIVSESAKAVQNQNLTTIAKQALLGDSVNTVLSDLVDVLVKMNNHDILETSGGLITINSDGLIRTPLGQVTARSISEASALLQDLQSTPVTNPKYVGLINDYLTLVPQKVPSQRGWHERFFNAENTFFKQREFLKQLSESIALREERKKAATEVSESGLSEEELAQKYANLFSIKLSVLDDEAQFKKINQIFEAGKSANHHASRNYKLKRVYVLSEGDNLATYEDAKARLGNEMTLWHGTRAGNLLSILRKGLYCPPVKGSSITIQGRMFGSGTYFAPAYFGGIEDSLPSRVSAASKYTPGRIASGGSTKSLNYSVGGVWDRGPRADRCFMMLGEGVLGREFNPRGNWGYGDDRVQRSNQYDSIYARAYETGLRNDEVIIWNKNQISVRYLCEFEK